MRAQLCLSVDAAAEITLYEPSPAQVTAMSTECPRVSHPLLYLSSCVCPLGPVIPKETVKFCLFLGSAGSHTPSEAIHCLKVVLKYCQHMPMKRAKAGFRWTCIVSFLLCIHSLPRKEDGDRQRKVCHMVPHLPHSQALPGDEQKSPIEDFE